MAELLSVAEAQERVLERARRLEAERVPVERAAGRVLAESAVAAVDLPPFRSSAMDGFAVRSADAGEGATLRVVGEAAAGLPLLRQVAPGEAAAIATGGLVPEGADAVIPLERVTQEQDAVRLSSPIASGSNIREPGGDVRAGEAVLPAGSLLGPGQVGALAAAGVVELRCVKRPRVGILVTGSELRPPGQSLEPGQIYESNGLLLAAALQLAGAVPAQLGIVADDAEELGRTMERALLGFDMLITSGGASVGPHDLVRSVQAKLGVQELFWGVAVKPGKPVAFGARRDHLVFNLPGNPVSALVCCELFVRPAVNALLGRLEPLPPLAVGTLASAVRRSPRRTEFLRAALVREPGGSVRLEPLDGQESHMIVSAAQAAALVEVPAGAGELMAGEQVRYLPLA